MKKSALPPHQRPPSLHPPTSLFRRVAILDQGLHVVRPVLARPCLIAYHRTVNSTAMPRLVGSSAEGSADEVDELQRALALCKTHCLALQDVPEP